MRKKLFTALGITMMLFLFAAFIVLRSLDTLFVNQQITNEQNAIISRYTEMLYLLRSAQAEMYRHQAGYSHSINDLVAYVEAFEKHHEFIEKQYKSHSGDITCMQCHAEVNQRIVSVEGILGDMVRTIELYKQDISTIITAIDEEQRHLHEQLASERSQTLIEHLQTAHHAADAMRVEINRTSRSEVTRSRITIWSVVVVTFFLSVAIFVLVIRSISRPIEAFTRATQTISRGDFTQRVHVQASDEIAFLAESFNLMASRLETIHAEKDQLLGSLQELNESLERRIEDATRALKEAQTLMVRAETLAAVGTLAAGVSHEISTPLNTIGGFCRVILDEMTPDHPFYNDMAIIEQESQRCRRIVQGLLQFSRTPSNAVAVVSVNALLQETLVLVGYQTATKHIRIQTEYATDVPEVSADAMQIKQVLLNIILNAIDAIHGQGELALSTRCEDDTVVICIADNGLGIAPEVLEKVFQPFFTTKKEGTGLGLAISYGIIREHGGDIQIESEHGKGTTVCITLPCYPSCRKESEWHVFS
ncbi:sensor histidine kinase [Chrysiogenes arsenatis]|uniref:sensor histidine kinase n=1 Tax=Chrysiogenes arsenatis TaxID=309797 RepID=UPI000412E12E|nr:HAMP domain-containing sensor histidine kinase [Chrysiogenes arsenatis]